MALPDMGDGFNELPVGVISKPGNLRGGYIAGMF